MWRPTTSPTCACGHLHRLPQPARRHRRGRAVVVTTLCYMLLASLAMGIADLLGLWRPRGGSVLGTLGSSLPPLVALVAAAF
jgi:hypothetical protein